MNICMCGSWTCNSTEQFMKEDEACQGHLVAVGLFTLIAKHPHSLEEQTDL